MPSRGKEVYMNLGHSHQYIGLNETTAEELDCIHTHSPEGKEKTIAALVCC